MTKVATILTPHQYQRRAKTLPPIWQKVAGSLRGSLPQDPVAWQRSLRAETNDRLRRQIRIARDDTR